MSLTVGVALHSASTADGARLAATSERGLLVGAAPLDVDHVVDGGGGSGDGSVLRASAVTLSQLLAAPGALTAGAVLLGPPRITDGLMAALLREIAAGGGGSGNVGEGGNAQIYAHDATTAQLSQLTCLLSELPDELRGGLEEAALATCTIGRRQLLLVAATGMSTSLIALLQVLPRSCVWVCAHGEQDGDALRALVTEVLEIRRAVAEMQPAGPPALATANGGRGSDSDNGTDEESGERALGALGELATALGRTDRERGVAKELADAVREQLRLGAEERQLLEERETALEGLVAQLTARAEAAEGAAGALRLEVQALRGASERHEAASAEATALRGERQALQAALERLEGLVAELQVALGERDTEVSEVGGERDALRAERDRLQERLAALEASVEADMQRLEADVLAREGTVEAVRQELERQRRENLTTLAEFQGKEREWQRVLRDAEALRQEVLAENERFRTTAAQQCKTLQLVREASQDVDREREARLTGLLQRVRDISPPRAASSSRPGAPLSAPALVSPRPDSNARESYSNPRVLHGHERVLDI